MQDDNFNINDKFTDQAWANMHSMLDQEMPVKSRKKHVLFWWLAGGLSIAASLLFIWAYMPFSEGMKTAPQSPVTTTQSSIATSEVSVSAKETVATQADSKLTDSTAKSEAPSRTKVLINSNETKFQRTAITNAASRDKLQGKNSNAVKIAEQKEELAAALPGLSDHRVKTESPDLIDVLPSPVLKNDYKYDLILPENGSQPKKIKLIAQANATFKPGNSSGGLGVSVLTSIPLGENNFSIETGLGYSFIRQPIAYLVEIRETTNSMGFYEAIAGASFEDYALNEDFSSLTANDPNLFNARIDRIDHLDLHYLQIPIVLSYRAKRFRFFGGIQAATLLDAKSRKISGGLFSSLGNSRYDESTLPVNSSPSTQLEDSSNFPKSDLSNFELSGIAGTGFDFSPRYGVSLSYIAGLTDVIKANSQNDFNRLFQFSLRYRW